MDDIGGTTLTVVWEIKRCVLGVGRRTKSVIDRIS
jgi:hypothetical protein